MADDRKETDTIPCNWCKRPTTHILRARSRRPRLVGEGEVEEGYVFDVKVGGIELNAFLNQSNLGPLEPSIS